MTLGELVALGQTLIDQGQDPNTIVTRYVDGSPDHYGEGNPAVLRKVTRLDIAGAVSAGNRYHFIRHADATSQEVIALA